MLRSQTEQCKYDLSYYLRHLHGDRPRAIQNERHLSAEMFAMPALSGRTAVQVMHEQLWEHYMLEQVIQPVTDSMRRICKGGCKPTKLRAKPP